MERRIIVMDGETNRLAATTHVLGSLFPDAELESSNFHVQKVRYYALGKALEILSWTTGKRAALVATNIDGVEEYLIPRIVKGRNDAIHCLITSCYDARETAGALAAYDLSLSPNLAHVECPSIGAGTVSPDSRGHRARLESHFSSLPPDHPFAIGSTSTTYSTRESETYAASKR